MRPKQLPTRLIPAEAWVISMEMKMMNNDWKTFMGMDGQARYQVVDDPTVEITVTYRVKREVAQEFMNAIQASNYAKG